MFKTLQGYCLRRRGRKRVFEEIKTIDKYEAFKMLAKSHTEEGDKTGAEEAFNQLENLEEKGEVLLIDSGLL